MGIGPPFYISIWSAERYGVGCGVSNTSVPVSSFISSVIASSRPTVVGRSMVVSSLEARLTSSREIDTSAGALGSRSPRSISTTGAVGGSVWSKYKVVASVSTSPSSSMIELGFLNPVIAVGSVGILKTKIQDQAYTITTILGFTIGFQHRIRQSHGRWGRIYLK